MYAITNPYNTDMTPMRVQPVRLEGRYVRLEPLSLDHVDGLAAVGLDPDLWRFIPSPVQRMDDMQAYVQAALAEQARGTQLPFAMVDAKTGAPIGCTRYCAIEPLHRRLEIGWTWIARAYHRSGVNTEVKTLMLTHAFETLGAHRVEFKTDVLNMRSRNAIERIGGQREGIFRRHVVCVDGRVRDTIYFAFIDQEWPDKKARLQQMLR